MGNPGRAPRRHWYRNSHRPRATAADRDGRVRGCHATASARFTCGVVRSIASPHTVSHPFVLEDLTTVGTSEFPVLQLEGSGGGAGLAGAFEGGGLLSRRLAVAGGDGQVRFITRPKSRTMRVKQKKRSRANRTKVPK